MAHVFVYGSLLFDGVVEAVTGRKFDARPAELHGHRRHAIQIGDERLMYPAIREAEGHYVAGRVLHNVDADSLALLDRFELNGIIPGTDSPFYERVQLDLSVEGETVSAHSYRATGPLLPHLTGEWCEKHFADHHLEHYVHTRIPGLRKSWEKS